MRRMLGLIGIVTLIAIMLGVGWVYWNLERPDVYRHSISSSIKNGGGETWGEFVNLIPGEFEMGENGALARDKLIRAGYERVPNDKVWARYADLIEDGKILYSREADNLVCAILLRIFVEFDADDQVVFAQGNIHEHGCL